MSWLNVVALDQANQNLVGSGFKTRSSQNHIFRCVWKILRRPLMEGRGGFRWWRLLGGGLCSTSVVNLPLSVRCVQTEPSLLTSFSKFPKSIKQQWKTNKKSRSNSELLIYTLQKKYVWFAMFSWKTEFLNPEGLVGWFSKKKKVLSGTVLDSPSRVHRLFSLQQSRKLRHCRSENSATGDLFIWTKTFFFSCCFCSVTTVIFFAHKLYLHEKEKYISTILKEFWLWCLCWIFLFPPDLTHCGLPKALVHFLCASSGVQLNYLPYMKLYWKILFYVLSLSSTLSLLFFSFMIT